MISTTRHIIKCHILYFLLSYLFMNGCWNMRGCVYILVVVHNLSDFLSLPDTDLIAYSHNRLCTKKYVYSFKNFIYYQNYN